MSASFFPRGNAGRTFRGGKTGKWCGGLKNGGESGIRTRGTPLKGVQSLSRRSLSTTQPSLRFVAGLSSKNGDKNLPRVSIFLAEGAGFEPANLSVNGFQDRRLRPLGHPSSALLIVTQVQSKINVFLPPVWATNLPTCRNLLPQPVFHFPGEADLPAHFSR